LKRPLGVVAATDREVGVGQVDVQVGRGTGLGGEPDGVFKCTDGLGGVAERIQRRAEKGERLKADGLHDSPLAVVRGRAQTVHRLPHATLAERPEPELPVRHHD